MSTVKNAVKKGEADYYLEDDDALMRLLERLRQVGEPGLRQRLIEAGEQDGSETITKTQFVNMLTKLGITPNDILCIQRIVGFYEGG